MKRTPLRRRAQLRAHTPLRRTTPLARTASLAATDGAARRGRGTALASSAGPSIASTRRTLFRGRSGAATRSTSFRCAVRATAPTTPASSTCSRTWSRASGRRSRTPVGHVGLIGALRRISGEDRRPATGGLP